MHEGLVNPRVMFIPHNKSMEVADPRDRSFDNPAAAVSSQFAAVQPRLSFSVLTVWAHQFPVLLGRFVSQLVTVVCLVGDHWPRLLGKFRFLQRLFGRLHFRFRRRVDGTC